MDVLILAAGLGSRVSKYTFNIIPKFLINIDDNTGLFHIIEYWEKYANNIHLVIHSSFYEITKYYIDNVIPSEYNYKINIILYDESDGTAFTLNYILNNQLYNKLYNKIINKNLLITWCDIYPQDHIDFKLIEDLEKNNVYVFTSGNNCRYALKDNKVVFCEKSDGNILGIFYIQNYNGFNLDNIIKGDDIVLYLNQIGKINELKINRITDYGDEKKLKFIYNNTTNNLNNSNIKGRYFNKFTILDNKLLKEGINSKGNELIEKERAWYSFINNNKIHPILYDNDNDDTNYNTKNSILIEFKKHYISVYQYFNNINLRLKENIYLENTFDEIKNIILNNIITKITYLHSLNVQIISNELFYKNLEIEIFDKIINRKKNIEPFINYFGKIGVVNDITINSFEEVLNKCKNIIYEYYDTKKNAENNFEYRIIHGDCQFSNILMSPYNFSDIYLIDPRGYFGETMIFGPVEYDYAKILYAISGYDIFNSNYFIIDDLDLENKSLNFKIPEIKFNKKIMDKYFQKVHYAFVVIIWIGLADYTKNNIWKCLASYYHGLYLGTLL
jgi:hypothetical protein